LAAQLSSSYKLLLPLRLLYRYSCDEKETIIQNNKHHDLKKTGSETTSKRTAGKMGNFVARLISSSAGRWYMTGSCGSMRGKMARNRFNGCSVGRLLCWRRSPLCII